MPWMTAEETAKRYRITPSGLAKQRSEGRMPGVIGKHVGKRVLWASEELDAYDRLFTDNPQPQDETFGALDALVLEVRGVNRRLDESIFLLMKLLAELEEHRPVYLEMEISEDE